MSDLSNSSAPPPPGEVRRMAVINTQYVKDLSFESPRAPHSLVQQDSAAPDVQVKVDVKAQNLGQDVYEVTMMVRAEAKYAEETVFLAELAYGAVVSLLNTAAEDVAPALMIETPRILFPFVRHILATVTRDGGFAPLLLGPIDFADMYRQRGTSQQPVTGTVAV